GPLARRGRRGETGGAQLAPPPRGTDREALMSQHRARRGAAVLAATTAAVLTLPLVALAQPPRATDPGRSLPLGAEDLPEVRETEQLAPGVTLTRIVRGETTASYPWTVE